MDRFVIEDKRGRQETRAMIMLDFSHSGAKGVGYARHQSPLKEVIEMHTLPTTMIRLLEPFAPLFSKRVFKHVQVLVAGAILAPGRRTVSSALRAMGLDQHKRFHRYHRVINRASWSSLEASRVLLGLMVEAFVPEGGPLVVGIDETLERRYGKEIVAVADRAYASLKLLDRCRSLSKPVTFITRLRFDAALYEPAPVRRPGQRGRPRLKGERLPNLSDVAEDPTTAWKPTTVANWYGSGDRMVEIASQTAVWYSTGLPAVPLRWVLVRDPEGEFKTQALLCTDLKADPQKIVCWFVMRWQLEVTFQEARRHVGFETQRQWSEMAIRRTTPALLGLFSLITLFAHRRMAPSTEETVRRVAWYRKPHPTFSDALALVRMVLWAYATFYGLPAQSDTVKVPRAYLQRLTDAVCYAA
jgi:hypothetical protein